MSVSCHFLLQAPQCPCSVRKRFSRDHCCRGRSKPGCRIVGTLKPHSNVPLHNNTLTLMGGLLRLVQRGGVWANCGSAHSLLAVPNVTAHQLHIIRRGTIITLHTNELRRNHNTPMMRLRCYCVRYELARVYEFAGVRCECCYKRQAITMILTGNSYSNVCVCDRKDGRQANLTKLLNVCVFILVWSREPETHSTNMSTARSNSRRRSTSCEVVRCG